VVSKNEENPQQVGVMNVAPYYTG